MSLKHKMDRKSVSIFSDVQSIGPKDGCDVSIRIHKQVLVVLW